MPTTLVRGDRFNEGLLAQAFEKKLLHRILCRVEFLARTESGEKPIASHSGPPR